MTLERSSNHGERDDRLARIGTRLSAVGTDAIRKATSRHGLSLEAFFCAAWSALLNRHGVQPGVRIEVRSLAGGSGLPTYVERGASTSACSVEVEVREDRSVLEHLEVVAESLLERKTSLPRYETFVAFLSAPSTAPNALAPVHLESSGTAGGADSSFSDVGVGTRYSLGLALAVQDGARFELHIHFDPDRIASEQASSLAGHLKRLMVTMALDAHQRLSAVPMLSERELQRLFVEWNPDPAHDEMDVLVHELFERQAEKHPDRVACVCEGGFWTYRELNQRANRLAHHLRGQGVSPGTVVAMRFGQSLESLVGLLGTLKAGGAFLTVDPSWPPERARLVVEDAGARAIVTHREFAPEFVGTSVPLICVDSDDALLIERTGNPERMSASDQPACVVYESGWAGTPLGVVVEHGQLLHRMYGFRDGMGLTSGASHATLAVPGSEPGLVPLLAALAWGGCLHLLGRARIHGSTALSDYLQRHRIDLLQITPSQFVALHGMSGSAAMLPRRWLVLTGEPLASSWGPELHRMTLARCSVQSLFACAGTTAGMLVYRFGADSPRTAMGKLPVGKPLPGARIYVVDRMLQPVPIGVAGELLIGGEGLARGYLNRPGMTRERFIPSPFDRGRVYRTGDRARYLPDGNLEYLGRNEAAGEPSAPRTDRGNPALAGAPWEETAALPVRRPGDLAWGERRMAGGQP